MWAIKRTEKDIKKNHGKGQIHNKSLTCLIMTQQRSQGGPGVAMACDTGALAQGHGTSNTEKATEQRGEIINWDERRETSTASAMDRTEAGGDGSCHLPLPSLW